MNRRAFLTLALASCTLGIAGCGRQATATPPPATPTATAAPAANASVPLAAPPVVPRPQSINESAADYPTRLQIPTIKVDIPVIELGWSQKEQDGQIFSEWDVAAYAAGWHINSALPGAGGNVVLSGHNNILGAVFRELDQLRQGDPMSLWLKNRPYSYAVEQVIVLPDRGISDEQRTANTSWIGPFDEERLTLVSCWPRNNNTHRIVVIAHPQASAHLYR